MFTKKLDYRIVHGIPKPPIYKRSRSIISIVSIYLRTLGFGYIVAQKHGTLITKYLGHLYLKIKTLVYL